MNKNSKALIEIFPILAVRRPAYERLHGMKKMQQLRAMVDETIIGGLFVRYTPDPGTIFMVAEKIGEEEYVRAFCPRVIWDQWGSFTVGAFQRCGCDETEDYWVERIEEEVIVTDAMTVYQVPLLEWMNNWQDKGEASQTKQIPPSPPLGDGWGEVPQRGI